MENYPIIPYILDKKSVIRRMGAVKADFSDSLEHDIDDHLKKARAVFTVCGRANTYDIHRTGEDTFVMASHEIRSALLTRMLSNSTKVYLMCATIPQRAVDEISTALKNGEGLRAIIFDAYASEYVDGALSVMMDRKNAMLKRTGQRLTKRRFSAGYGDLDIKYQKLFYDMLDMHTMDVVINDKFLLTPEKNSDRNRRSGINEKNQWIWVFRISSRQYNDSRRGVRHIYAEKRHGTGHLSRTVCRRTS